MLIAVINQKGGVGKSTIATHLAVWLHEHGKRVAFIDADGQASSSQWISDAEPGIHVGRHIDADEIFEQAEKLRREYDVVVGDGPANLADATRMLLLAADLALIPCGPSFMEIEATVAAIRVVKNCQKVRPPGLPPALLVLNRLRNERFKLTSETIDAVQRLGVPVCTNALRYRDAVADSCGQRSVVWRMGARAGSAAKEMREVLKEVIAYAKSNSTETDNAGGAAEGTATGTAEISSDRGGTAERASGDADGATAEAQVANA